jgi:dipeptidyl aminopeptidase/acylaminoacyl peptidase
MYHTLALVVCLLLAMTANAAETKRPMKLDDMFKFKRVSDPQISPDGKTVAYVVTEVDLEGNKTSSAIWLAPPDISSPPRVLTTSGKKDRHPRWSPDGKKILFVSNRSGNNQLWLIDLGGGEARQVTSISTEADNPIWSRDGKTIAFVSAVYPEFSEKPFKESDAANKKKMDEIEKNPVKAKVFTQLFYRHWDSYVEDKRQHLFVIPAPSGSDGIPEPRDVTPGDRDAFPTSDTFATDNDITFSPDGKYLLYTSPPERDEAWSTNYDIWRVPVAGGKPENLTQDNAAADGAPSFSPDGKWLAYRAQKRAGYEADRWQIYVVAVDESGKLTGKPRSITEKFDGSPESLAWADGGNVILFPANEKAEQPIFQARVKDGAVAPFATGHTLASLSVSADGRHTAFTQAALTHPPEVWINAPTVGLANPGPFGAGVLRNISNANTKLLAELDVPAPQSVTVPGDGAAPMQMWILKPPGFDAKKKWPVAFLVHGGPQGAWEDGWSFRWNASLWAAQGYVVVLPNPRGSTGFGQKYVDEISGDWGGKCYRDLVAGLDYVEKLPYVDKDRMGAAGASFGGYMMDWFAVNDISKRFKCLISHCSVWNFESMWGTTDELWFDEYEHGGLPWEIPGKYREFSPHTKAGNLGKFKTPMLLIQNDLDFRCPIGQGHELFSALQRQHVPSRFINFPDEGHWVLKPKNSERWHQEVFAWLTKHVPPGGR